MTARRLPPVIPPKSGRYETLSDTLVKLDSLSPLFHLPFQTKMLHEFYLFAYPGLYHVFLLVSSDA
jgi:hypothetical protein